MLEILVTASAQESIDEVNDQGKRRKIEKAIAKLEADPTQRSLESHRYESFDEVHGQKVWESYVENQTPSAWRIWWFYGPEAGQLTIVAVGPHR